MDLSNGIPGWVQIASGGIGLAIAVYVYISAQLKNITPKTSSDVVMPSMTIADSAAIRGLVIELQNWAAERRNDYQYQQQVVLELRDMNRTLDQIWGELRNSRKS